MPAFNISDSPQQKSNKEVKTFVLSVSPYSEGKKTGADILPLLCSAFY
jgi:hypothetical protein